MDKTRYAADLQGLLDDVLRRRKLVRVDMAEAARRDRELDREIADLKAAARVFGVELTMPPDESERPRVHIHIRPDGVPVRRRIMPDGRITESVIEGQPSFPVLSQPVPTPPPPSPSTTISKRPPIREIVLDRLRGAGAEGKRASAIQKYIERVYGAELHQKTVGMTLYRLAQEGLVRREGRTWFFVQPEAETENPGVGAPGSESSAS
jgi:hypothetical protein